MWRFVLILSYLLVAILRANAAIDVALQMQLGNPSGAMVATNNYNHYLLQRTVEAIDYSDTLGEPIWASWDYTTGDSGMATPSTTYVTDNTLPANFYHVTTTDYNGVGNIDFNRAHSCPSADRTDTGADNAAFYMSNIMPQSPQSSGAPPRAA